MLVYKTDDYKLVELCRLSHFISGLLLSLSCLRNSFEPTLFDQAS